MAEDNYVTSDNPVKNKGTGARQFAARPGWHIGGTLPDAPWLRGANGQYNSKRGRNFRRVWAEVSYPMDVDYQAEADANASRDIKGHIPADGYYLFNESNRGTWVITGALRVDRVLSDGEVSSILRERGYDAEAAFEPYRRSFEKRAARKAASPKFQSSFESGQGLFRSWENPLDEPYVDAGQVLSLEQIETMRDVQEENRGLYPKRRIRELSYGMTAAEAWEAIAYATGKFSLIARDAFREAGIDAVRYETHDGRIEYAYMDGKVRHAAEWYETKERLEAEGGHYDKDGNPIAPNGKKSNLTKEQYITVRTPSFKRWFGDWERRERVQRLTDGEPLDISGVTTTAENAKETYKAIGSVTNRETGRSVDFVNSAYGKIVRHKGYDPRLIGALKPLFEDALYLGAMEPDFETPRADGTLHKNKVNIKGFSYFLNRIRLDGKDYLVRYTVQDLRTRKGTEERGEFHSQQLTNIKLSGPAIVSTLSMWADEATASDSKLASLLESVKKEIDASKVMDENGEPKVVYHNSWSRINVFVLGMARTASDIQAFFFAPESDPYAGYGPVEHEVFLDIRRPASYEEAYAGFPEKRRYNDAGARQREELVSKGFDGVIAEDGGPTEYLAFYPSQIKSATENTGTFDPANGDIRFQDAASRDIVRAKELSIEEDSYAAYESAKAMGGPGPARQDGVPVQLAGHGSTKGDPEDLVGALQRPDGGGDEDGNPGVETGRDPQSGAPVHAIRRDAGERGGLRELVVEQGLLGDGERTGPVQALELARAGMAQEEDLDSGPVEIPTERHVRKGTVSEILGGKRANFGRRDIERGVRGFLKYLHLALEGEHLAKADAVTFMSNLDGSVSPAEFLNAITEAAGARDGDGNILRNGDRTPAYGTLGAKGMTVDVKGLGEYEDCLLFLSPDRQTGFAIHGHDLVSVFSTVGGRFDALMLTAIAHGATTLDCYDVGVLLYVYQKYGFSMDASVGFNPEYAGNIMEAHAAGMLAKPSYVAAMSYDGLTAWDVADRLRNKRMLTFGEAQTVEAALPDSVRFGKDGYDDALGARDRALGRKIAEERETGMTETGRYARADALDRLLSLRGKTDIINIAAYRLENMSEDPEDFSLDYEDVTFTIGLESFRVNPGDETKTMWYRTKGGQLKSTTEGRRKLVLAEGAVKGIDGQYTDKVATGTEDGKGKAVYEAYNYNPMPKRGGETDFGVSVK